MIESRVSFSDTVGRRRCASTEMPKNVAPRIVDIQMSVRAAFLGSGARNAGTPFEIASTPESATAPDEKARSNANNVTPVSNEPFFVIWSSDSWFTGSAPRSPKNDR